MTRIAESLGTVDKAIDILLALASAPAAQGVTALGRSLNQPKSSTHRLLATLTRRGLVERDEGGRYRPGMALVALGVGALERDPLWVAARPVLEEEARSLGETVFLVAARAGRLVVLDKVEGTGFLRAAPQVGSDVPVHATAVGKLFLAFAPDRVAPDPDRPRFTDRTLSKRDLAAAVAEARERACAENRDEWIEGLSVVAAPITCRGDLHGALAVAASTPRLRELGTERVIRCAQAAAARVGARLEGRTEVAS
jgi:DNA-binding IclR family transcriptional regulator